MAAKRPRTDVAAAESDHSGNGEVVRAIGMLQELQNELEKINEEADEKIAAIECIYMKIRNPVYARRNNIISCIPDFWLTAFFNQPVLEKMLTECDQKILGYLDSLIVEDFPDPRKGYCITFTFKANPYFEDRKLTRTIEFCDDGTVRSTGTCIMWKQVQGSSGERNNDTSRNKWPLLCLGFFNWISDPWVDMDRDLVAEIIKDDIWPNAIEHFRSERMKRMMKQQQDKEEVGDGGEDD